MSTEEIKSILATHKNDLASKYGLASLAIFGSHVRGDQEPDSDVDILVEFEKPIGLKFVDLAEELENLLKLRVDLVSRGAIKARLWKYVERDLIYV